MKVLLTLFLLQSAHAALAPALDPSEEFPGGSGTIEDDSVQAFSHPMSGTRGQERRDFSVGNSFFNLAWVEAPASTTVRDGLGPLFNAVACSACHFRDGRGGGLPEVNGGSADVSLLFRLKVKQLGTREVMPHPVYGGQFQPQGISGVSGEGDVKVTYKFHSGKYADQSKFVLAEPIYEFIDLAYGELDQTIKSPRVAPQMIGLGLVELIADADIIKNEDPFDSDGDGISGRSNRVYSIEYKHLQLGRFGWKAGKATLKEQNAAAFNGDMGISNPLFPQEECTSPQTDCLAKMTLEDLPMERLNLVTKYTQLLAPPKRRNFQSLAVNKGREHFYKINCQTCHVPGHTTTTNERIWPYSDFLLHDMGDALADDKEEYFNEEEATTREWRTPPLWGLGLVPVVNSHTRYLHDGRARSLEEAILWHGGEAQKSKQAFMNLTKTERTELIEFLNDL